MPQHREPEMSHEARWLYLRTPIEHWIGNYKTYQILEDDFCNQLRRLLPLIAELEQRPKLRWLMPLQHHAVVEFFWPEDSERAWESIAYFYEKAPDIFSVTRISEDTSEPQKRRYEVVFVGPMQEAIAFFETLAEALKPTSNPSDLPTVG